jgi:hypothetical protein
VDSDNVLVIFSFIALNDCLGSEGKFIFSRGVRGGATAEALYCASCVRCCVLGRFSDLIIKL